MAALHSRRRLRPRFVPWNASKISRWSGIDCPACHARLNRRFGLRKAAVLASVVRPFGVAVGVASPGWMPWMLAAGLPVLYLADVSSMPLTRPRSFSWWLGYRA